MKHEDIKAKAEADLEFFIRLVSPTEHMGSCHQEVIQWWTRQEAKSHQLLLFPRDHGKSRYIAYRVVWELTRNPTIRVLYISSTSNLAEKQLSFIKGILTSAVYRRYWPEMVNPDEGHRRKWNATEIEVDHPLRAKENVRDPSIFCAGLTTNIVGMHCDIAVLDDVVTNDTAYTEEGRRKVRTQYSFLSSIEGADAKEWVVGTRYHPKDLYNDMLQMKQEIYSEDGELLREESIYEVHERAFENIGDGSGEFLWPRSQRKDGKWFGFNRQIWAKKKGQYLDQMQFRAQYYNDPNDPDSRPIDYDKFQYFDKKHLTQNNGYWYYHNRKLNVLAAIDFNYSLKQRADYTAIVVIGVDADNNYYVLDIDRIQTDSIKDYFTLILNMANKWDFRKLVAETTAAQQAIVRQLKEEYFAKFDLSIRVEEVKPTRHEGTKQERMAAILIPRYENGQIYHYRGGMTQLLEEELVTHNPPHDDLKDALSNAIDKAIKPVGNKSRSTQSETVVFHPRFGGRAF